ncbi:MAG TPA: winged helix-turn-helix domain-containing protein [Terriglobales bacterium]|nr:winged helix-turn-helix domain-containing protein [Terriglobales bacterium]
MSQNKIFRFGVFEADPGSGELRKAGMRLRLHEQPFQTLLLLVERPGEVVSREELRQKLWPADTFVDFDHSLNTIINKLREVLGDSASSPRFIETLAKRGYRFLPAVEVITDHGEKGGVASAPPTAADLTAKPHALPTSVLTRAEELPKVPQGYVRLLFLLIQIMYLSFYIVALARLSAVEEILAGVLAHPSSVTAALVASAAIGIPIRCYLLSAVSFDIQGLRAKFSKLFPAILLLDELWGLSPFLLSPQIGLGLALGITAALIYVPFAQRTLVLMRES